MEKTRQAAINFAVDGYVAVVGEISEAELSTYTQKLVKLFDMRDNLLELSVARNVMSRTADKTTINGEILRTFKSLVDFIVDDFHVVGEQHREFLYTQILVKQAFYARGDETKLDIIKHKWNGIAPMLRETALVMGIMMTLMRGAQLNVPGIDSTEGLELIEHTYHLGRSFDADQMVAA